MRRMFFLALMGGVVFFGGRGALAESVEEQKTPLTSEEQSYRSLEIFAGALHHLSTMYVDPQAAHIPSLIQFATMGMVQHLDPHTTYMSPEMFARLHDYTKGQYGGVGLMVVRKKDHMVVVSVVKGSPAHRQGIEVGDVITAINGAVVVQGEKSLERIRGEPGTEILLKVLREGKLRDVRLVREVVAVESVFSKTLSAGIVYIRITNFQEDTSSRVEGVLREHQKNLKGLILDLRNNPGGLLDEAVKVSDLFVEAGVIVSTMGRDPSQIEREYAFKKGTFGGFPMIVLVNQSSASASEIVAGALQDHERGLVMGQKTFGKGSVQTLISLPDGGGLKITVARYYTPGGRSIQLEGIQPDILLAEGLSQDPNEQPSEDHLRGRISGKNLGGLSKNPSSSSADPSSALGVEHSMSGWSEEERKDESLKSAYLYLRGWLKMKVFKKSLPS